MSVMQLAMKNAMAKQVWKFNLDQYTTKEFFFRALRIILVFAFVFFAGRAVLAPSDGHGHDEYRWIILLVILYVPAKIFEALVQRVGAPSVLGALAAGIIIRSLEAAGIHWATEILADSFLKTVEHWGAIQLLFNVGLESNLEMMASKGWLAAGIAFLGAATPMAAGALWLSPWFYPDAHWITHVFMGACMVATSVGITASILTELGLQNTLVGQIIIAAAVIDDVIGVVALAIVSATASGESMSGWDIANLIFEALMFLSGSIALGHMFAPQLSRLFSRIHQGIGMRMGFALGMYLFFAWLATKMGLEPILGAFCAGLVLDPVHFSHFSPSLGRTRLNALLMGVQDTHKEEAEKVVHAAEHHEVEEMFVSVSQIIVTIFFAYTGLQMNIFVFFNPQVIGIGLVFFVVASLTKIIVAFLFPGSVWAKLLGGLGMAGRGEVGLIFGAAGINSGFMSQEQFAVILFMVVTTTLLPTLTIKPVALRMRPEEKLSVSEQTSSH